MPFDKVTTEHYKYHCDQLTKMDFLMYNYCTNITPLVILILRIYLLCDF